MVSVLNCQLSRCFPKIDASDVVATGLFGNYGNYFNRYSPFTFRSKSALVVPRWSLMRGFDNIKFVVVNWVLI